MPSMRSPHWPKCLSKQTSPLAIWVPGQILLKIEVFFAIPTTADKLRHILHRPLHRLASYCRHHGKRLHTAYTHQHMPFADALSAVLLDRLWKPCTRTRQRNPSIALRSLGETGDRGLGAQDKTSHIRCNAVRNSGMPRHMR